jgi:hypothetical protein
MTGPEAGNYSVTLDGTIIRLTGKSPFTVYNTSLYFATGLNTSVEHFVEVENEGGKLSLFENGFITFLSDLCVEEFLLSAFSDYLLQFYFGSLPITDRRHALHQLETRLWALHIEVALLRPLPLQACSGSSSLLLPFLTALCGSHASKEKDFI